MTSKLSAATIARQLAAFGNRLALPYDKLPVRIGDQIMYAHRLDRYVALWLLRWGLSEPFDAYLIASLCKPGMQVIDIGANTGYYTLLLSQFVGESGQVWSFEPESGNFGALGRNLAANHNANVSSLNLAVGQQTGTILLYRSTAHGGDHRIHAVPDEVRPATEVSMVALDDFLPPTQEIDFIKMDIQGAEGLALQGMRQLIARSPHISILLEVWPKGLSESNYTAVRLLEDLRKMNLTLEGLDEHARKLYPIASIQDYVGGMQPEEYRNILARRSG